ncbi:MAG: hypothetical protein ACO3NK_01770 [Prochlorotrichaceae cyanobacterium]
MTKSQILIGFGRSPPAEASSYWGFQEVQFGSSKGTKSLVT